MIYDLVLAYGWLPRDVRALTVDDLDGIAKAAKRAQVRSKAKGS